MRQVEDALARQTLFGGDLVSNLLDVAPPPATDEQALALALADALGLPAAPLEALRAPAPAATARVTLRDLEPHNAAAIALEGGMLVVAVAEAPSNETRAALEAAVGGAIKWTAASQLRIRHALSVGYGAALDARSARQLAALDGGDRPKTPEPSRVIPTLPDDPLAPLRRPTPARMPSSRPPPLGLGVDDVVIPRAAPAPMALAELPATAPTTAEAPHSPSRDGVVVESAPAPAAPVASEPVHRAPPPTTVRATPGAIKALHGVVAAAAGKQGRAGMVPVRVRRRGPFTRDEAERTMADAESVEVVLGALIDFASQFLAYVAMFLVREDVAEGLDAHGEGASGERLRKMGVPLDMPSLFAVARTHGTALVRPRPSAGLDAVIATDLGRKGKGDVIVLPVVVGKRVVALLYGDDGDARVTADEIADVLAVGSFAGIALAQQAVRRRKSGTKPAAPVRTSARAAVDPHERAKALLAAFGRKVAHDETAAATPPPPSASPPTVAESPAARTAQQAAATPIAPAQATPTAPAQATPIAPAAVETTATSPAAATSSASPSSATESEAGWGEPTPSPASTATKPTPTSIPPMAPREPDPVLATAMRVISTAPIVAPLTGGPIRRQTDPYGMELPGADLRAPRASDRPANASSAPIDAPANAAVTRSFSTPSPTPVAASGGSIELPMPLISARKSFSPPIPREEPDDAPTPSYPVPSEPELIEVAEVDDAELDALLGVHEGPESERAEHRPPRAPPAPIQRRTDARLPKVMVAIDTGHVQLVARLLRGGPAGEAARAELSSLGVEAVPALMDRFPGPTRCDRTTPLQQLPPPAEAGPLLSLLVDLGRLVLRDVAARLGDASPETRFWAAYTLSAIGELEVAPELVPRLVDDDLAVRRAAAVAARAIAGRARKAVSVFVEPLVGVLLDRGAPSSLRVRAAQALGELREGAAAEGLVLALEEEEPELESAAKASLRLLAQTDPTTRGESWSHWLAKQHGRSRIEWLIDALMDDELAHREAAAAELKALTRTYFGYYADLPRTDRQSAQQRYRAWWEEHGRARFA